MICSIIYWIIKYPEVKKRLRSELDTVLGTDPARIISYEDLNKLEYTKAVIQEISRLHPVAPFTSRLPDNDDVIGGYPIKVINRTPALRIICVISYHIHALSLKIGQRTNIC